MCFARSTHLDVTMRAL